MFSGSLYNRQARSVFDVAGATTLSFHPFNPCLIQSLSSISFDIGPLKDVTSPA